MYRQLYQMGGMGIESLSPMQPAMQPAMQSAMYTPLENTYYSGMPMMMAGGGRMGYQEGDIAMSQPEGIMNAMPGAMQPEAGGMMQEGGTEQTALLTIIQLLIEQGVPPEQAQELAMQILQVFNQGGAPAVEEFANQLEQEEGMSEDRTMMAGGGINNLYPRQGFFIKGVVKSIGKAVKGVGKAVKSIAKSPIGQIALAVAAPYAIGAMFPAFATLGGTGIMGAALRAGISNLAIQGITTGKINPKQALLAAAAGGALSGISQGFNTTGVDAGTLNAGGAGIPGSDILVSGVEQGLTPVTSLPVDSSLAGQVLPGSMVYNPPTTAAGTFPSLGYEVSPTSPVVNVGTPQPNPFEKGITSIKDFGTNLMTDPLKTLGNVGSSIYQSAKENIVPLSIGTALGAGIRPQAADESDEDYQRYLTNRNAEVARFEDLYRTGIRGVQAANGGRIGYEYGSMPMGEPRRNPAGIMELDYRAKGGFVPPIGIKEKADDIPAMLSNNEFVFTADAVRNAGEGNVNKGAQRMYGLMKQLEAGGVV